MAEIKGRSYGMSAEVQRKVQLIETRIPVTYLFLSALQARGY